MKRVIKTLSPEEVHHAIANYVMRKVDPSFCGRADVQIMTCHETSAVASPITGYRVELAYDPETSTI